MADMKESMQEIMKKAQEMQTHMQKAQKEITNTVVEGVAGGGLVKVKMNGNHQVLSVYIAPSLMDEDEETIADLVAAAFNDATKKIEEATKKKMMEIAKEMKIPENFSTEGDTKE
jgi:DNA-binding YbaB/EbfC family protein